MRTCTSLPVRAAHASNHGSPRNPLDQSIPSKEEKCHEFNTKAGCPRSAPNALTSSKVCKAFSSALLRALPPPPPTPSGRKTQDKWSRPSATWTSRMSLTTPCGRCFAISGGAGHSTSWWPDYRHSTFAPPFRNPQHVYGIPKSSARKHGLHPPQVERIRIADLFCWRSEQ